MKEEIVLGGQKLPVYDYYLMVLLHGNTIVYKDIEMTDLTPKNSSRLRIQVYKKSDRTLNKNKQFVNREYNKIHYNYNDAISDFMRLRGKN